MKTPVLPLFEITSSKTALSDAPLTMATPLSVLASELFAESTPVIPVGSVPISDCSTTLLEVPVPVNTMPLPA